MNVPSPWVALILTAAAFRIWRVIAVDVILERPRRFIARLPYNWEEGQPIPDNYRNGFAEFLLCPWCLGFHVCLVLWLCWLIFPTETLFVSTPFALSAAVGIIRGKLDPPDE